MSSAGWGGKCASTVLGLLDPWDRLDSNLRDPQDPCLGFNTRIAVMHLHPLCGVRAECEGNQAPTTTHFISVLGSIL